MKRFTETELAKELRQQYIKNPPEGMTSDEVLDMSDDDLLDMDYFLHEFEGYRTKRVDGLIPFNKRSVIIM